MPNPEHDARLAWCRGQRVNHLSAPFGPGEVIRCPGIATLPDGRRVKCGARLLGRPKPNTRVIVRAIIRSLPRSPYAGKDLGPCPECRTPLEEYVVLLELTPLEATG